MSHTRGRASGSYGRISDRFGTVNPANSHRFSREQSFDSEYTKLWAREKSRVLKIQSHARRDRPKSFAIFERISFFSPNFRKVSEKKSHEEEEG